MLEQCECHRYTRSMAHLEMGPLVPVWFDSEVKVQHILYSEIQGRPNGGGED